jgi:hypothetical protein
MAGKQDDRNQKAKGNIGLDYRFSWQAISGSRPHHEETKSTKIFSRFSLFSSFLRGENLSLNSRPLTETALIVISAKSH